MSVQLYIGPSGAGKSHRLFNEVISGSIAEPRGRFYIIVPDQFNMETQKTIVMSHPDRGITNIEVLSFSRLTHRVFEEIGLEPLPVLDDTGKNLILRRLMTLNAGQLTYLAGRVKKQGYVHEVKSAISEFMQYGIDVETMDSIVEYAGQRPGLYGKLKDLSLLYKAFLSDINGRFVTTEGLLGLLERGIHRSRNLKDSVFVFDGFTGFTPIQLRVIGEIMQLAKTVKFSVIMDPHRGDELFSFSRKMIDSIYRTAEKYRVLSLPEVVIDRSASGNAIRFEGSDSLGYLERNLFRPVLGEGVPADAIHISEADNPREEIAGVCARIKRLVRTKGLEYRDFAVVSGDLGAYGDYIRDAFNSFDIPFFMDSTKGILQNPFTEYIKYALEVIISDFSYESVLSFLRCGFTDIDREAADRFELFIVKYNIKGSFRYKKPFYLKDEAKEADSLTELNETRERIWDLLSSLMEQKKGTAGEYTLLLYRFLVDSDSHHRLCRYEDGFREAGDLSKASEYGRIYRFVMDLLNQIYELAGEELMTLREYLELLCAGFSEISLGSIPQDVDRVSVGDMERSRLSGIKVLFFMGVNDGNIPGRGNPGGIISDIDREFLSLGDFEMSPTPREQMIIQKLYLYMNMTKPSLGLYLSYSRISAEGSSLRPSYLIREIQRLFPGIHIDRSGKECPAADFEHPIQLKNRLSRAMRDYLKGDEGQKQELSDLIRAAGHRSVGADYIDIIKAQAFYRYEAKRLTREAVEALYGHIIKGSISRLEMFAECAFRYYLQYGLRLREKQEYEFGAVDMGSLCHLVLEEFSHRIEAEGRALNDFDDESCDRILEEIIDRHSAEYKEGILESDARHRYIVTRLRRLMKRTVYALRDQYSKGDFLPAGFEQGFTRLVELPGADGVKLGSMRLVGTIDRMDTADAGDSTLVRVIDYKTGAHNIDAVSVYYGLQLQLAVYLGEAVRMVQAADKARKTVPAGLLYYHIQDPFFLQEKELSDEGIVRELKAKLRMTGLVDESETVIKAMDRDFEKKSSVIPVTRSDKGGFSSGSGTLPGQDFNTLIDYAAGQVADLGGRILEGHMEKQPYAMNDEDGCAYCPYTGICGFDRKIPGYSYRRLSKLSEREAIALMAEKLGKKDGSSD